MKLSLLSGLVGICLGVSGFADTLPIYHNIGILSDTPSIDATIFVNSGDFEITSGDLFDTENTLDYTNTSSAFMYSPGGFRFNYDTNGFQHPARTFFNQGQIIGSEITVQATNLLSSGVVDAIGRGLVSIQGENVNLDRGGFRADSAGGYISVYNSYGTLTSYVANGTNNVMEGPLMENGFVDLSQITLSQPSPSHEVQFEQGGGGGFFPLEQVPLSGNMSTFAAFAYTNQLNPTSMVVQVMFVNTNLTDTNMFMKAGFLQAGAPSANAIVQWALPDVDVVDGKPFTNYVTFVDSLPNVRSNYLIVNYQNGYIDRPLNYQMYQGRDTPYPFSMIMTNVAYDDTLIVPTPDANTFVTNTYGGWYGAVGQDTVAIPSFYSAINPALFDPTNAASRVEIKGDNLDLTNTRLRAGTILKVTTQNLLGNVGCQIDAPVMRWDIGSTNGLLNISNLAPVTVARISGSIQAYSCVWTNAINTTSVDATGTVVSNTVTVYGHAMYLDHSLIGTRQMQVYDATFHSTNVAVYDSLYISKALTLDCDGFYNTGLLNGDALSANLDWASFARLNNVTNDGTIDTGSGSFLENRSNPISNFVNRGTINSGGINVSAASLQNSGTLNTRAGIISLQADQAKLDGGTVNAISDINLKMNELKVRQSTIIGNTFNISVTNVLTDGGPVPVTDQNNWKCAYGFNLNPLPAQSDLRGTRILSFTPKYPQVNHTWAGKNYGATAAGFTNNAALGGLILDGSNLSKFQFDGTDANKLVTNNGVVTSIPANAIYTDYLEFRDFATNYNQWVGIGDNIVIYFATSSPFPAEQLDGAFNGHLRWVKDYVGPASSTTITLANGQNIDVNTSLLNSSTIDSNGNGVPNAQDPTPFDFSVTSVALTATGDKVALTWSGAAQTVYSIDYTTSLVSPSWQFQQSVTNTLNTNTVISATVPKADGVNDRYYRVRYTP